MNQQPSLVSQPRRESGMFYHCITIWPALQVPCDPVSMLIKASPGLDIDLGVSSFLGEHRSETFGSISVEHGFVGSEKASDKTELRLNLTAARAILANSLATSAVLPRL